MGRRTAMRVVAQDPVLRDGHDNIVTSVVSIPEEVLDEGPRGERVAVVDYDSTRRVYYRPWRRLPGVDPDRELTNRDILDQPWFHAQNAYALVMRTLVRFERALGRRVSWGGGGPQLHIVPHAFEGPYAYYSPGDASLVFGYYPGPAGWVYTALSHEIVVHETTHALLDGVRSGYLHLAHPEQAGFQEGFSDAIALLSAFTMPDVIHRVLLSLSEDVDRERRTIDRSALRVSMLGGSVLRGLAERLGEPFSGVRGQPLRRAIDLVERKVDPSAPELRSPEQRGELFIAAVMSTFLGAWFGRLGRLIEGEGGATGGVGIGGATQEANEIAEALLDVMIKALDYAPPVDLRFGDYLSALVTSDSEVRPDDSKYHFRAHALHCFRQLGISPSGPEPGGLWSPPPDGMRCVDLDVDSKPGDPHEMLGFLWRNRRELRLEEDAHTHVLSVHPSLRVGGDGHALRETVVEYKQTLCAGAAECAARVELPARLAADATLKLRGGGLLIFDEEGCLKYHVAQRLFGSQQAERLAVLWNLGLLDQRGGTVPLSIAALHAEGHVITLRG